MYKLIVLFAVLAISCQVMAKPHPGTVAGSYLLRPSGYFRPGVHDATFLDTRRAEFERRENAAVRVIRSLQDKSDSQSSKSSSSDESLPSIESTESPESVESRQSSESSESSESRQ